MTARPIRTVLAWSSVALLALWGCGQGEGEGEGKRKGKEEAREARSHVRAERSGAMSQRIVSLAPAFTELLFALGAGDRVVGISRFCDRPPAVKDLPRVGDAKQVALEAIVSLHPDLILVNSTMLIELLRPLADRHRIEFVASSTVGEVLDSVEAVGAIVGANAAATELRARLEGELAAAAAKSKATANGGARARGRVLVILQHQPFIVAGVGSYVDELIQALGWENAAAALETRWPTISDEALLQLSPDVILDVQVGRPSAEVHGEWGRFKTVPAVVDRRVHRIGEASVVRPGPSMDRALKVLRKVLEAPASGSSGR